MQRPGIGTYKITVDEFARLELCGKIPSNDGLSAPSRAHDHPQMFAILRHVEIFALLQTIFVKVALSFRCRD
jgi:hypothetical protein